MFPIALYAPLAAGPIYTIVTYDIDGAILESKSVKLWATAADCFAGTTAAPGAKCHTNIVPHLEDYWNTVYNNTLSSTLSPTHGGSFAPSRARWLARSHPFWTYTSWPSGVR